jgi:hypothetical protein
MCLWMRSGVNTIMCTYRIQVLSIHLSSIFVLCIVCMHALHFYDICHLAGMLYYSGINYYIYERSSLLGLPVTMAEE